MTLSKFSTFYKSLASRFCIEHFLFPYYLLLQKNEMDRNKKVALENPRPLCGL